MSLYRFKITNPEEIVTLAFHSNRLINSILKNLFSDASTATYVNMGALSLAASNSEMNKYLDTIQIVSRREQCAGGEAERACHCV